MNAKNFQEIADMSRKKVAQGLFMALMLPSFADAGEGPFLLGKVYQGEQVVLSFASQTEFGKPLLLQSITESSYPSSVTDHKGKRLVSPGNYTTGLAMQVTTTQKPDGQILLSIEGKDVQLLGFQKFPGQVLGELPELLSTEFRLSKTLASEESTEIPFGKCALKDNQPVGCQYVLTVKSIK